MKHFAERRVATDLAREELMDEEALRERPSQRLCLLCLASA